MSWGKGVAILAVVLSAAAFTVRADEPTTKPVAEKPAKKLKVIKPYSSIDSLTDEQRVKISEIHKKALDEIDAIRDKEKADITALLTDEQKVALAKLEEEEAAKKKMTKEKPDAPTTKPAKE